MPRPNYSTTLSSLVFLGTFFSTPACMQALAQTTASEAHVSTSSSLETADAGHDIAALPDAPSEQAKTTAKAGPVVANAYSFPAFRDRRKAYLTDLSLPGVILNAAFQAGSDQAQSLKVGYPSDGYVGAGKHPAHGVVPEWGEGFDGYTKRYASRFGMGLIGTTSQYGLGEILREDISYHPCQCAGLFPRAYHAVTQSLVARTHSGRSIPSLPALASPFIGAEVATVAWYPSRYNASDALRTSTSLYYGLAIRNLITEFRRR